MRKFNIYLHIGTEKTGTTTIQNVLKNNSNILDSHGAYYYYSKDINNARNLASACIDASQHDEYLNSNNIVGSVSRESYKKCAWDDFYNIISVLPPYINTVIISSEHFHSRLVDKENVSELYNRLNPIANKITVVCYLRRQVDMVLSLYSTILKGGGTDTLKETLEKYLNPKNQYSNYSILLDKWSDVFGEGNLVVKKFDKDTLVNNNIVDDIFNTFSIDSMNLINTTLDNESLTPLGQFLMAVINSAELKNTSKIKVDITKCYSGKGILPSKDILDRYQDLFNDSNLDVSRKWFPDEFLNNEKLFKDIEENDNYRELSDSQINVIDGIVSSLRSSNDMQLSKKMKSLDGMIEHLKQASKKLIKTDLQLAYNIIIIAETIRENGPEILRIKEDILKKLGEHNV